MKKFAFCAMALALVGLTVGCTKDGKYNPKEKISKIYTSSTHSSSWYDGETWHEGDVYNTPKHLSQAWTWDGKKLMSIADYDSDGENYSTAKFEYDGSQLSKITEDDNYSVLEYDGKKLASVKTYSDGQLVSTAIVTHDGKKIVKIEATNNADIDLDVKGLRASAMEDALWTLVMPADARPLIKKAAAKSGAKASTTETITFEWDGDNVSKVSMTEGNGTNSSTYTMSYTYDKMKNPYYGFLYEILNESGCSLSENNAVSMTYTSVSEDGTYSDTENYTYKYDGKWPIERTNSHSYEGDGYRSSGSTTTYYEYAD